MSRHRAGLSISGCRGNTGITESTLRSRENSSRQTNTVGLTSSKEQQPENNWTPMEICQWRQDSKTVYYYHNNDVIHLNIYCGRKYLNIYVYINSAATVGTYIHFYTNYIDFSCQTSEVQLI